MKKNVRRASRKIIFGPDVTKNKRHVAKKIEIRLSVNTSYNINTSYEQHRVL
jgi:hypothetical protein